MNGMRSFTRGDPGYLSWVEAHPDAFVINTHGRGSGYLVLHRAYCSTIKGISEPLPTWQGRIPKLCGDREELEEFARGASGGSLKSCRHCM